MTTKDVAIALVAFCREGQSEQAMKDLYADNIVSIEPTGSPNSEVIGIENVIRKSKAFYAMVESFHGTEVSDPVVGENFFSCSMKMDLTFKGAPRSTIEEICVYQVTNGKIVNEQFFYTVKV